MPHVLIVKLSSMGDLVHALPAVTDAAAKIPDISFDWVVDESFKEIPIGHPAVDRIIKSAHRRWRKNLWQAFKDKEISNFVRELRTRSYDFVIDAQANYKSAVVTRLARGVRCGYDRRGVREAGVHFVYAKRCAVAVREHAITRIRELFAQALNYSFDRDKLDYGFSSDTISGGVFTVPPKSLIFVHNTSWQSKSWPMLYWCELAQKAANAGYTVLLTWGNEAEKQRAEYIASSSAQAIVLPRLSIAEFIPIAAQAKAAVCMDTGFGHIISAVKTPAVTLYGPSDPTLVGAAGESQIHIAANTNCSCYHRRICRNNDTPPGISSCLAAVKPAVVWDKLSSLI